MIRVAIVDKPATFDQQCANPGATWLLTNPKATRSKRAKLPAHWTRFVGDLEKGFGELCAYAAMHTPTGGTVDHYISVKTDESKAYSWSNYRFASGTMNNIKRNKDDKVLDPFTIGHGWFEISLPDLQMKLTATVPTAEVARAKYTLIRMKLRDDERILKWRRSWYERYERGGMTLDELRKVAPLIAEAVDRRNAAGALP